MPHIIVEYSANIEERARIDGLLKVLHEAAFSTGVAELAGFRTRAERRDQYRVADADPVNCFVAITIRVARGRSAEDLKNLLETVTAAATSYLEPVFAAAPISFSCEVQEIVPEMRINKSNVRNWMKTRESAA
ncbi:MAG: 5-carboxymethyl-2-hydroxymuconate isomerase [Rhizobiales bacterium]|nr:5-carboxymethyl-2-hydroxymuconate isomerase [Hyphomicrobiales bacterium]